MKSQQRWYRRHQLFNQSFNSALLPWLFDTSSLTARMICLCDGKFSVKVISQRGQRISADESAVMLLRGTSSALVRKVLLCCDEQPLVYARTVIPASTIQGAQRRYANMGNRPLGAMLFADRTMRREVVQVAKLPVENEIYRYTKLKEGIWGRRSVFRVSEKPILVSEYFLPELIQLGTPDNHQ